MAPTGGPESFDGCCEGAAVADGEDTDIEMVAAEETVEVAEGVLDATDEDEAGAVSPALTSCRSIPGGELPGLAQMFVPPLLYAARPCSQQK